MNPYEVLGVSQAASEATIESAFRKLSLDLHPDKANALAPHHRHETQDERAAREARNHERFVNLVEARDILLDADRREEYDEKVRREKHGKYSSESESQPIGNSTILHMNELLDRMKRMKSSFSHRSHGQLWSAHQNYSQRLLKELDEIIVVHDIMVDRAHQINRGNQSAANARMPSIDLHNECMDTLVAELARLLATTPASSQVQIDTWFIESFRAISAFNVRLTPYYT